MGYKGQNLPTTAICVLSMAFGAVISTASAKTERVSGGWYQEGVSPIPVMHLEGSIEDVARAHGEIAAKHPEIFKSTPLALSRQMPFSSATQWLYRHFIRNRIIDHIPERYQNAYQLFAQASGIPLDLVWDTITLPDGSSRLNALLHKRESSPALPLNLGSTSILWNAGSTSVLHARNLDHASTGTWDQHPLILHIIPQEGLAHVSVTAQGVHAPGLTSFNEAGLTLAVHALSLDDTQSSGTPMLVIAAEIMRNARTIDDAISIVRGFPRSGSWAYVLSRGRDRAVIESSANEIAIRRSSEPFFYQTNHAASPALASHEIFSSPGLKLDSFDRAERLHRFSANRKLEGQWATPQKMAELLSDYNGLHQHRVAGGTIARLDNVQSVVIDASLRRLWIGVGSNDAAPGESEFAYYRWSDLRSPSPPEFYGTPLSTPPEQKLGSEGGELRRLLRKAASNQQIAPLETYARKVEASAKDGIPSTGTWAGLYLYAWSQLRMGEAPLKAIELALKDPDLATKTLSASHRFFLGRLTRARALDLLGRRPEALFEYAVVAENASFERLKAAALQGLRRRYDAKTALTLRIDWAGIDLLAY